MLVYQRVNIVNICGSSPTWRGSRVATRLGPMINQLLGGNGLLDPNMTSFLVDGSMAMVYHWFYHMTSLKLRESQPRCQVSAAVVLAAFFTMQRWLYPAGGTMNTGSWGHHMGHLFGIQGKQGKENPPSCGNGWHPWDLRLFWSGTRSEQRPEGLAKWRRTPPAWWKKRRAARCMQYYVDCVSCLMSKSWPTN